MNILLIGSGGREHALAWKIAQSKKLHNLYIAPGNAGTAAIGKNVSMQVSDFEKIGRFCRKNLIHMVVVGPEVPLVNGIHDFFLKKPTLRHIPVIGPQKSGARLEGSKDFAKQFMIRHKIPTAKYLSVNRETFDEGLKYLSGLKPPYVLKADGLAAGKGVIILNSPEEAKKELQMMLAGKFGDAGKTVVIEEFLRGIELSVFVLTDGKSYKLLPEAKDYKRVGVRDTGLNTGGMGAISPVPFASGQFMRKIEERIIRPTIDGLQKDEIPYKGFIFFGLINCMGDPYVIEYNARMGDPEAEVVLPRLKNDIITLFEGVAAGTLKTKKIEIAEESVSTVMLVSGGYPEHYEKGKIIYNLDKVEDCILFHAGTRINDGDVVTSGGRVIAVSAYGKNFKAALSHSYRNAELIKFDRKYFRTDIGFDL